MATKRQTEAFSSEEIEAMLKEAEQSKFVKTEKKIAEVAPASVKLEASTNTGYGYGVVKLSTGKYAVVELSFNYEANTSKIEGIVETTSNKTVAGVTAEEHIRRNLLGIKRKVKRGT